MLAWQIGRHRITAGAQYEYSFRVDQWNYDAGGATYLNDHRAPSQTAGYTQAELKLLSKLAVNAGARLDWFSAYGSSLDPRLAVIYTPTPRTALKYIFGRAFRAPNAYETYYADGISLTSNLNLKPEIIQSHEAVLEHNLKPWLQITAGGFYADMQRLIDQVFDPFTGLNHYVNSGSETSKGLELEIAAKRKSGLSAQASYTLSDARDSATGDRAANSPLHLAKLHVAGPATRRGSAGLELLYASAQESYQGARVPGYVLTNITFLSKPLWNGWTFSASCYNLFDRRWWTPAGADLRQAAILQDGRSWRVKLTYHLPERPRQQDKK
jgi:iron complex outermembrane receptor protein